MKNQKLHEDSSYFLECYLLIVERFGLVGNDSTLTVENVEKFLNRIYKKISPYQIGSNYLFNYITYTFKNKYGKGYKFSWLISQQAVSEWFDKEEDWFEWNEKWKKEHGVHKPVKVVQFDLLKIEDFHRKRYLNEQRGLVHCMENTTLIDPESQICRKCKNKLDCKELLRVNNPELCKIRYGRVE